MALDWALQMALDWALVWVLVWALVWVSFSVVWDGEGNVLLSAGGVGCSIGD